MVEIFDSTPYLKADEEAGETQQGIWSSGDKHISPRLWRKMHKGG